MCWCCCPCFASRPAVASTPSALPKKATVLALRDALQENAPAHISTWLLLLGKLLDEVEGVDSSERNARRWHTTRNARRWRTWRNTVAEDLDTDAGFAVVQTLEGLTATGALLIQRAAGGRRLDEDSDTRTLDLAASLARAAFELSCGAWQPLANLQTAVGALQCLCAPKKRGSASVLAIELVVSTTTTRRCPTCGRRI